MKSRSTDSISEEHSKLYLPGTPPIRDGESSGALTFLRSQHWILASFVAGLTGACTCFGFTFWLSSEIFECPDWAINCSVLPAVAFIREGRALIQGVVSTLYDISIAMLAFASFQIGETTLWPSLVKHPLAFRDMDKYISTVRGSLFSAPTALRRAQGAGLLVLITATLVALVQLSDNVIVGHAFSLANVTTALHSEHTQGGGVGISFVQYNPPGVLPAGVTAAINTYNLWASNQVDEPMPHQRNFIVDRANLSAIGNFSAQAVELQKSTVCSAQPINITQVANTFEEKLMIVSTSIGLGWTALRLQPMLAVWVDSVEQEGVNKARTRLMFAAINGTIEGGHKNTPPDAVERYMRGWVLPEDKFRGISSLACDVSIELKDSSFCTYNDAQKCHQNQKLLTSLSNIAGPGEGVTYPGIFGLAVWLAAAIETYGVSVSGAQPMFQHPGSLSTIDFGSRIPPPWTSFVFGYTSNWSQEQLKYFMDVSTGALAMSIPFYPPTYPNDDKVVLLSELPMSRMETRRSFILLVPPGLLILTLLFIVALSSSMHKSTDLRYFRFGTVWDFARTSQTQSINRMLKYTLDECDVSKEMEELQFHYDKDVEGHGGLVVRGLASKHGSTDTVATLCCAALGSLQLKSEPSVEAAQEGSKT